jgi:hypothetical protein
MKRREAIGYVATLLGGVFSAPTLLALERQEAGFVNKHSLAAFELSAVERQIVAEVAEMIIPRSDTPGEVSPGAKDAGVPAFIEMMLKDCYAAPQHSIFLAGVKALEKEKFLEMDAVARTATLKKIEAEAKNNRQTVSFWRLVKELTLLGYFTSEVGIKASFEYVPIPGKFETIKLKPNQKAYAY